VRYVTEDGRLVGADATTPVGDGTGPGVIEGVLTSSSVPMIFEPRPFGDDVYVDGGVLQNIPVEAAVRCGAQTVVGVVAVPLEPPPPDTDFTRADFVSVFLRSASEISFTERQRTNLAYPLPAGGALTVIAPTVDVVGPFDVSRGLLALDMDYGWLRAQDALAGLDPADTGLAETSSDEICVLRERCWYAEEALLADRGEGPAETDLAALRDLKRRIADAVDRREALGLRRPEGSDGWSAGTEEHDADTTGLVSQL
jgi:predicted acylesterase/phospholipase RssA